MDRRRRSNRRPRAPFRGSAAGHTSAVKRRPARGQTSPPPAGGCRDQCHTPGSACGSLAVISAPRHIGDTDTSRVVASTSPTRTRKKQGPAGRSLPPTRKPHPHTPCKHASQPSPRSSGQDYSPRRDSPSRGCWAREDGRPWQAHDKARRTATASAPFTPSDVAPADGAGVLRVQVERSPRAPSPTHQRELGAVRAGRPASGAPAGLPQTSARAAVRTSRRAKCSSSKTAGFAADATSCPRQNCGAPRDVLGGVTAPAATGVPAATCAGCSRDGPPCRFVRGGADRPLPIGPCGIVGAVNRERCACRTLLRRRGRVKGPLAGSRAGSAAMEGLKHWRRRLRPGRRLAT